MNFAGMCWRIVRIEGDGSIKLILEDQNTTCNNSSYTGNWEVNTSNYGYTYDNVTTNSGVTSSSKIYIADYVNGTTNSDNSLKNDLESWLSSSSINTDKLKQDNWCLGNTTDGYGYDDVGNLFPGGNYDGTTLTNSKNDMMYFGVKFYYSMGKRLAGAFETPNATLRCDGVNDQKYTSFVGTLTADEVAYAGGRYSADTSDTTYFNQNYYLINDYGKNGAHWWTLTLHRFLSDKDTAYYADYSGMLFNVDVSNIYIDVRPSINLNVGTLITGGNGTQENPYVVE